MDEEKNVDVFYQGKKYAFPQTEAVFVRHYLYTGGKVYHTYLDCYEYWPDEYREKFHGWRAITKEEAEEKQLRCCKRCQHREDQEKEEENPNLRIYSLPRPRSEHKPVPKWLKITFISIFALLILVLIGVHFLPDPEETTLAATEQPSVSVSVDASVSESASSSVPFSEYHLYDHACEIPVIDPDTSQRMGTYTLIKADSATITDSLLVDWYENHVMKEGNGYSLIVFSDKNETEGIYAFSGFIVKNVQLEKDSSDPYEYKCSFDNATYYSVENGRLVESPITITD